MDKAYWSEKYKMHVYTKHDDVVFIMSNPEIFISGQGNLVKDNPYRFGKTPGASDGEIHTWLRSVVKEAYSKSRIDAVNGAIRDKTYELLKDVGSEPIDIAKVIRSVSAYMSAEIINLPGVDKNYLADLIVGIQLHSDRTVMYNTDNKEYDEFVKIIRETVGKKVPHLGPGIYQEFMDKNTPPPWISLFTGPVISGCYSMISALEFTIYNLYKEGIVDELHQNLDLIPNAVQEALRFNATTGKFARTVNKEITLGGIDLKVNDRVAVCLDAASRDPAVFENPNSFNLNRKFGKSHPFGYGPHACAGLAIARAGLEEFLRSFFEVYGKYEVLTTEDDLEYIVTSTANNDVIEELIIKKI
jgi:cytochrome P450